MSQPHDSFHLFEVFGVELEYMLVDAETLNVRPEVDKVLFELAGEQTTDVAVGHSTWSNELALHVIELKTSDPTSTLAELPPRFDAALEALRPRLAAHGMRLLPTAMHPWMDPRQETVLWPHEYAPIYRAYDRIFDCRRHGWGNIQSVHLNLPFTGDAEFGKLMAAIRLILPLIPALAASSPIVDSHRSAWLDTRLQVYRSHCDQVPLLSGDLIPEAVYGEAEYRDKVLAPIMHAIRPLDPDGCLQNEFLNARGAIARFDRGSIEIRLIDVQEYPAADVAICAAITAVLRALVDERFSAFENQAAVPTPPLADLLWQVAREGERAVIDNREWLSLFAVKTGSLTAGEWWDHMFERLMPSDPDLAACTKPLTFIRQHGSLSQRIVAAVGEAPSAARLKRVYRQIADCLDHNRPFAP